MTEQNTNKSEERKLRKSRYVRINVFFFLVFLLFVALIVRLGVVQIVQGEEFSKEVSRTESDYASLPAPRGKMYDRYNRVVVDNTRVPAITYTVDKTTSAEDKIETAKKLAEYINYENEFLTDELKDRDIKDYWLASHPTEAKELLSKKELVGKTDIKFGNKNLLITYHPVTLEKQTSRKYFKYLLDVLSDFNDIYLIFTMPNADSDGRIIKQMIDEFVSCNKQRSISFTSMGHINYLSTLQFVDGVVGNSSSGLVEAPTFKIGTINIGDRQKGRLKADSVIDCQPTTESIQKAITTLYSEDFRNILPRVKNPYGKGDAIEKIMEVLYNISNPKELKKEFYDL